MAGMFDGIYRLTVYHDITLSYQIFHYTRCITSKHVTSLRGSSSRHCALEAQLLLKKYRIGGEPLATQCPI